MTKTNKTPIARRQRLKIGGQFVGHQVAMIQVLLRLPLSATRILNALEIEHCRHGGRENGKLVYTYSCFMRLCGISRRSVPNGLNELETAGLIERTRPGRRAHADLRVPTLYRITYLPTFVDGEWVEPSHDWKQKTGAKKDQTRAKRDTETAKYRGKKGSDSSEYRGKKGDSYLDLGVEGGVFVADEYSLATSPPAHPQDGAGLSAPPPPSQLPSATAPSSGSLH